MADRPADMVREPFRLLVCGGRGADWLESQIVAIVRETGAVVWRGFFEPFPGAPYIADCRTFDIPETVAGCIEGAAPGMVAITLSRRGGAEMIRQAEIAARARGASVLWWDGPDADMTRRCRSAGVWDAGEEK